MIVQGSTTTFAQNLLNGNENFTTGTYYIALYNANANLNNTTQAYTTTNEMQSAAAGYGAHGRKGSNSFSLAVASPCIAAWFTNVE